ncbi:unnamed protein product, partial [Polarella glacialis]
DVSAKVAGAEARASAIEVSLLKELERIAEDLRIGIGNLDKTQLVSRVGVLEEQSRRSSLVLSTLQEERQRQKASSAIEAIEADLRSALSVGKHGVSVATLSERAGDAMSSGSLASAEKGRDSMGSADVLSDVLQIVNQPPDQSKLFISSGIRERLTGLVSALSWTLGQAGSNPDGSENQDGTESGSGSGGAGGGNSTGRGRVLNAASDNNGRSRSTAAGTLAAASALSQSSSMKHRARTTSPGTVAGEGAGASEEYAS